MMKHTLFFKTVVALTLIIVFGITTTVYSQSNSVVGLTVAFKAPMGPLEYADTVYYVKLEGDSLHFNEDQILQSSLQIEHQIYLTDLQPGNYAIVAIGKKKEVPIHGLTYLTTFFSKELIQAHTITVAANDFVFIGDYTVKTKMLVSNKKADEAQLHYFELISGKKKVPRYRRQVFLNTWFYKAGLESLELQKADEQEFLKKSLKHFEGTALESLLREKNEF